MPEYKKYPYRSEFPDSTERAGRHQSLEDALRHVRWNLYWVRRSDDEYGRQGDYIYDTESAVITNRNTGYRWILRRGDHRVEFQTSQMFEDLVAQESIALHLRIEEAEALAIATKAGGVTDTRTKALSAQALDQIAYLCRAVRERVRLGDESIDPWTSSIPRKDPAAVVAEEEPAEERPPRRKYRPLGDPDNLTLKEAGEILGKARNTVWLWYRKGKFPPAVDVRAYLPHNAKGKPVIVVPRYRLEAWRAGEPMPDIFQVVFESHGLHEPPWVCYRPRKGSRRADIDFWVKRRGLTRGQTKDGRRIYGQGLDTDTLYEPGSSLRKD